MAETKEKDKKTSKKSKKHKPNTSDFTFKPSSDVKGLRFGGQFIVKSFTVRRARPPELIRLLSLPPSTTVSSTVSFIPTNFTILAHHAWHTLTLGLGTKKSKVVVFVFESEGLMRDRRFPVEIELGEVNKKVLRGCLDGLEMARFKFRKGCLTFYVYAVRRRGDVGFACSEELRLVLESVVKLKDFFDHTAMLAMPEQRSIDFSAAAAAVGVAH